MNAVFDVTDIRIETPRLILRPWEEKDAADLFEYACVPGVGEAAGWNHHKSIEESRQIVEMFIREKKTFALELKETGKVIGSLGIEYLHPDPVEGEKYGREIGYVLSKDYWGKGYMPEAVNAVIGYCFDILGYDYLTCGHFEKNSKSRRVVEKCGFTHCGTSYFHTHYGSVELTHNYILHNPNKEK